MNNNKINSILNQIAFLEIDNKQLKQEIKDLKKAIITEEKGQE